MGISHALKTLFVILMGSCGMLMMLPGLFTKDASPFIGLGELIPGAIMVCLAIYGLRKLKK